MSSCGLCFRPEHAGVQQPDLCRRDVVPARPVLPRLARQPRDLLQRSPVRDHPDVAQRQAPLAVLLDERIADRYDRIAAGDQLLLGAKRRAPDEAGRRAGQLAGRFVGEGEGEDVLVPEHPRLVVAAKPPAHDSGGDQLGVAQDHDVPRLAGEHLLPRLGVRDLPRDAATR